MFGRKLTKTEILDSIHADSSCFVSLGKLQTDERYRRYINNPEVTIKIIPPTENNNLTINNNDDCKNSLDIHQFKSKDIRDQQ